jgi:phospholipid/cholesterol/gamma-HCH transport system permease protein
MTGVLSPVVAQLAGIGAAMRFLLRAITKVPRALRDPRLILDEVHAIGLSSLPVVSITSVFAGTVLAVQGYQTFRQFGAQDMVGLFVSLSGVREMAPILAAAMVAAKAGAAITSDLAAMKNGQQIDAMEVMAVDPMERLVAPKLVAALIALPALTIIASFLTVLAAGLVAVFQLGVESAWFMGGIEDWLGPEDLYKSLFKSVIFAFFIWGTSCWQGFAAGPGPEGVGTATNRAIVIEVLLCLIGNVVLTAILYTGMG